jgi:hypothetical protein
MLVKILKDYLGMRKRRKQKAKDTGAMVMGVAWYRRDQWDRLLEISSDRTELEDTYDEWKAVAEENLRSLAKHGYKLRKGKEIKKAIKKANKKYPNEALKLDGSEINDVASYYDYLLEHENIIRKISQ